MWCALSGWATINCSNLSDLSLGSGEERLMPGLFAVKATGGDLRTLVSRGGRIEPFDSRGREGGQQGEQTVGQYTQGLTFRPTCWE